MKNAQKKLSQLPEGWKIEGEGFRLDCADGMYCRITQVKDGYVCVRFHADGTGQSGAFEKTWKRVVEIAHA